MTKAKPSVQTSVKRTTVDRTTAKSDEEPELTQKSIWKFFVAFGLILLLVIAIPVYTNYKRHQAVAENQYNGFDFNEAQGGLWITRIEVGRQPYDIPFYYHPRDVENITVDPKAIDPIVRGAPRQIFISVDPDAGAQVVVAGVEISRLTGSRYNIYNIDTKGALSRPTGDRVDLPIMNCTSATPDQVVIQFVKGSSNVIARSSNPSCVILQYTDTNSSVRVADRYAYMLLRIM